MKTINKNKVHKILIVRTERFVGDALLNIPAIRALKTTFNSFTAALINPEVKELFEQRAEIDELIYFDEQAWKKSIWARIKLLWQMRRKKFDLAVMLNPTKRFHIFTFLAGIPRRLGYNRKWGFLLTHKIKDLKFLGQKHEVEYNLDLVRSIGADTPDKYIYLRPSKEDAEFVERLLTQYGIKDQDSLIAMHPYSTVPAKCWSKENFVFVADRLQESRGLKVVIIGAAEEKKLVEKLRPLAKFPLIDLTGALTLKRLAAFLQRCALLICNDSGPMHIAAAVGTPTVGIFGRNIPGVSPKRWGPWGEGHIVLHKDPGCDPCFDRKCPYGFKCLSSITPEEVLAAAEKIIRQDNR